MFGQKPAAQSGGLTLNTSSSNSLFGNAAQSSATPTTSAGGSAFGGSLFGTNTATSQPQTGGLFGGLGSSTTTTQPQSSSLFGGTATSQPQTSSLFGGLGNATSTSQPQQQSSGGLFGATAAGTSQPQQQSGGTGGSLFGQTGGTQTGGLFGGAQQQSKPLFSKIGQSTTTGSNTGGLFGTNTQQQQQPQQQQQQQQGPTLSLFGSQNTQQNKPASASTVVPGIKIDVSNLVPTTKFESCSDELKREIEAIDTAILNQMKMCNEVSDLLPKIAAQGASVPNDVEYVKERLDALQEALENDAAGIEEVRTLVKQDAADAKLAFRALDTLLLPLQYQITPSDRLWSSTQQASKHSLRSALGARHSMLALPEHAEADSSDTVAGGPTNLVEYFSQRADDMNEVVESYRKTLKEVEDHLHGLEYELHQQINALASAKAKEGESGYQATSRVSELAATLADVETAILGVASRLGSVKEEVQELTLGPLGSSTFRSKNGW
ncbi:hypothetical protein VTO42DRAFT_7715 [Malbranchea cinnamomea]